MQQPVKENTARHNTKPKTTHLTTHLSCQLPRPRASVIPLSWQVDGTLVQNTVEYVCPKPLLYAFFQVKPASDVDDEGNAVVGWVVVVARVQHHIVAAFRVACSGENRRAPCVSKGVSVVNSTTFL